MLGHSKPDSGPLQVMAKFLLISVEMTLSTQYYLPPPLQLNIKEVLLEFSLQNVGVKGVGEWALLLSWVD